MARKMKKTALTPEERLRAALVPEGEQPYPVPGNWCWVYCKIVAELFNGDRGVNYPSKKDYVEKGIPFINAGTITNGVVDFSLAKYITKEKYDLLRAGKTAQGDILYCLRGSLGKVAMIRGDITGAISSSLCILRSKRYVENEYLFLLLQSQCIISQQHKVDNGTAQPNLSAASVMNYAIPLPPIPEQQRIVARIESLFAKLDEAKEKVQAALDSFEPRKAAVLHRAFSGELTKEWRKTNHISIDNWEHKAISEFAQVKGGKRLPKGRSLQTEPTEHPYLRIADFGVDTIDTSDLHFVSEEIFTEISQYIINYGDVYISIVGTIGKVGTIPPELNGACLTENAARIIATETLPKYLQRFLSSPTAQENIKGRIRSATLGKLSLTNIKAIKVPIPSLIEQTEIVRILDAFFEQEAQAKAQAEAALEAIDTMKKSILAKAFRGELGTNNPGEESAVELLKQSLGTENL